ncbi:Glycerol uptake facilitator protein [Geodia barretti]|uniref:Glycerol uptake facilitator protein n=1 Tax=Geodia barretti TaxID=519541 RepID=A0AA35RAP3_GEOBA|nr:Glycerol uptake facilitator protein [Geodia barretti]
MRDLIYRCIAEVVGTWLMVFVGTSVVAAAVLTGAQAGLWQVAVVWALGVSMAIYLTGAVSGAHLNPAVSLAFALFRPRDFPLRMLLPYWFSQMVGAILAGLTVLLLYRSFIRHFEEQHGIERGDPGSQLSTMMFGEYFPNPGMVGVDDGALALVTPLGAAAVEAVGTGILVLMIFALVDRRNTSLPVKYLAPVFIGLTVAMIISMLAPLTMGGWNPARDFGPRLVAFFAGWGEVAIPGPSGGFWAYIVGPLIGGPLGAAVYEFLIRPAFPPDQCDG